ncbi:MAG: PAS domain S-box protein, partial [Lacibacter sp.]
RKDKSSFPVEVNADFIRNSEGEPVKLILSIRDITQRKRSEQALIESETKYRELVENSPDSIVIYQEGKVVFVNNETVRLMAAETKAQLIGKSVLDFVHPDYRPFVITRMKTAAAEGTILPMAEEKFINLEGTEIDVEVKALPIVNQNKPAVQLIIRDITESKKAELLKQEAVDRLLKISSRIPGVIYQYRLRPDGTSCFPYASNNIKDIYQVNPEDVKEDASKVLAIIHPDDLDRVMSSILDSAKNLSQWKYEYRVHFPDKSIHTLYGNAIPQMEADGSVLWHGYISDITERKEAEKELAYEQYLMKELMDHIPDNIYFKDYESRFIRINKALTDYFELTDSQQATGKTDFDFFNNEHAVKAFNEEQEIIKTGQPLSIEEKEVKKDGSVKWTLSNKLPLRNREGVIIGTFGISKNITERKEQELALQASQQITKDIINTIPVRVFWKDRDLKYMGCNEIFAKDAGLNDSADVIGHDDYSMGWKEQADLYRSDDIQVIESGVAKLNIEEVQTTPDGKTITLLTSKIPLRNTSNEIIGVLGTYIDISARKSAEEELRESEEKWRKLVNSIPDFIALHDLDAKFTFLNHYAEGFSEKDVVGKSLYDFISQESRKEYSQYFEACIKTNETKFFNHRAYGDNGAIRTYENVLVPIVNKNGEVVNVMAIAKDITDRLLTEEAIKTKADQLERTGEIAKVGGWEYDLRTKKRFWSKETCSILEIYPSVTPEFDTSLNYSFYTPESFKIIQAAVDEGIVSGKSYDLELQMKTAKDNIIWVREQGTFLKEEGKVVKLFGVIQDITERKRTEEALRSAHQSYFDIFNSSSEAIYILDETGTFIDVNKGAEEMYLFTKEELIGQTPASVAAPGLNDLTEILRLLQSVRTTGIAVRFDFWAVRKNGEVFPKEVIVNRGTYFEKNVLIATARDITERKVAEDIIRASEERYKSIIAASPDGVVITDLEGSVLMASPVSLQMFGIKKEEELSGQLITDYILPADRQTATNNIALMFQGVMTGLGEYRAVRKDGTVFYMEVNAEFIRDEEGDPLQMVFIVRDITLRKLAEEQLRESEHFLNETQRVSRIGSYKLDIKEGLWESSLVLRNMFGIKTNGKFGIEYWQSFIHPDCKEKMHTYLLNDVIGKKQRFDKEYKVVNQLNGKEYWVHGIGDLELDENGLPVKMIGTIQDITEKKEAEEALHAKDKLFRALIENGNDGVVILNAWGVFKYIAPSIKSVLGYNEEELLNTSLLDITHPDDYDKSVEIYKEVLANPVLYTPEFIPRIKHKDGSWRSIAGAMNNLVNDPLVKGIIGNFRDVTQQVLTEQAIRESEIKYRSLIDNAGDAIAIFDKEGNVLDVNATGLNMLGFSKEEILKRKVTDFFMQEEMDAIPITYPKLQPGESTLRQRNFINKNGTLVLAEVKSQMLPDGKFLSIIRDITERIQAQENLRREKELSDSIIYRLPGLFYLYDEDGHFIRWNKNFEIVSGYSNEEIKTMRPIDFYSKKHHYIVSNRIKTVFDKESPGSEVDLITKQGTKIPFYINSFTIEYEGKRCLTGIGIDLTAKRKAEMEVAEKTAQLENLSDNLPETMMYQIALELDGQVHFTYLSKAIELLTGKTAEEVMNNSLLLYEIILEEDRQRLAEAEQASFLTMSVMNIDVRMRASNGNTRWINLRSVPRKLKDGRVVWDGVHSDITERKSTEEQLRISEGNYSSLVNTIEGIVWEADAKTTQFSFVSKQAEQILGYPAELWITEWDFWPNHVFEADREWAMAYCAKFTKEKKSHDFEYRMVAADGRIVWLHDIVTIVVENDEPVKMRGLMIDITEQKKAEGELKKSNRLFSFVSEINQMMVRLKDEETVIKEICRIAVNFGNFEMAWVGMADMQKKLIVPKAFAGKEQGYLSEIKAVSIAEDVPEGKGPIGYCFREGTTFFTNDIEHDPRMALWKSKALKRGYRSSIALPIKKFGKTHGVFTLYVTVKNYFNKEEVELLEEVAGNLSFILESFENEKMRVSAEKKIADYRFALDQSSIVDVSDSKGVIRYANENFCRISGYSLNELKGKDHRILKSGYHSKEHYINLWETVTAGKVWRAEVKNKAKDGSYYWVDSTIIPFLDDNGKPFQFITIRSDITKRKEAETQILNALERYDILSKATSDTIWDWDVLNNMIIYNQGIVKNFGYKVTKVKNVKEWWDMNIHPDDREKVQEEFEKAFQKRKSVVQVEYRYRSADGNYRHILDRAFIIFGANKKPERMIGSMQDITNEKEIAIRIEKEVIDAQEREWNQIGMELHDNVNQILAASMLLMGLGKEKMERGLDAASIINESEKHVGEAIAEIRRLSHQLAPVSVANLSLEQVFESLFETINVNKQFKIKLQMKGMKEISIPQKLQINLYRILQEQLNNIMKHAKASEVTVSFKRAKHSFVFKTVSYT